MKKTAIISMVAVLILVISMAFSFNQNEPQKQTISFLTFNISGCPGGDCSNLSYCLDGGPAVLVGNCTFTVKVESGTHKFCIKCNGDQLHGGLYSITCVGEDIYIPLNINNLTKACECSDGKKSKK
jgi:hypothetical protein